LIVYAANPLVSSPQQEKIRRGLLREDLFTVVMEHFLTDTADYADIVLPATMQIEHADLHDGYGHLYITWNEPAVHPPGECLSTTETFRQLAKYMGLTEPCLFDDDLTLAKELLSSDHPSLDGITLETLRAKGWMRLNYPQPFAPYRDGFPTASGKLEFLSERAAADGHDPLVGYSPAKEAADQALQQRYPFLLVTGASHYILNSTFANHPVLKMRTGEPKVSINYQDAQRYGIVEAQMLRVHNDRGAFFAAAEVTDTVKPGILYCSKGLWPKITQTRNSINATVEERDADLGGGAVFGDNRVAIEVV
jgi:anaerobic selenocysteine-containing dehydrogenase